MVRTIFITSPISPKNLRKTYCNFLRTGYNVKRTDVREISKAFGQVQNDRGGEMMRRVYVTVNCDHTADGQSIPRNIKWDESRSSDIRKVLYVCTSPREFEGIRYTILVGSAEKYLYKVGDKWYVELQG